MFQGNFFKFQSLITRCIASRGFLSLLLSLMVLGSAFLIPLLSPLTLIRLKGLNCSILLSLSTPLSRADSNYFLLRHILIQSLYFIEQSLTHACITFSTTTGARWYRALEQLAITQVQSLSSPSLTQMNLTDCCLRCWQGESLSF